LALQAAGSRCSIRIWFMRSLVAKIWTAARPSWVWTWCWWILGWRVVTAACSLTYITSAPSGNRK